MISDGGQLAALVLLVGAAGAGTWRLVRAAGARLFGGVLRGNMALVGALAWPVLLAVSAATGHLLTATALALLGATAWVMHRRQPLARGAAWVVAILLTIVFGVAYPVEGWWFARGERIRNEAVDVYVVLPFLPLNDESAGDLLQASEHYRSTLETVFSDLDSVRVLPSSFSVGPLGELPPQCTSRRLDMWVQDSLFFPDYVLCSRVDMFDEETTGRGITLVSWLNRVEGDVLVPLGDRLDETAAYDDIQYVALRTILRLLDVLVSSAGIEITAQEQQTILTRIVDTYEGFLSFRGPLADAATARLRAAESAPMSQATVAEALDAYVSPVDAESYAARQARTGDALLNRVVREQ